MLNRKSTFDTSRIDKKANTKMVVVVRNEKLESKKLIRVKLPQSYEGLTLETSAFSLITMVNSLNTKFSHFTFLRRDSTVSLAAIAFK